jgi:serine/threonine-protein kinase
MELLEGEDLGAFLDTHKRMSPELTVQIVAQLARALDRAHEKGIVHRDIKPGNIFLCYQGGKESDATREVFVKLLDFGIAKFLDDKQGLTRDGMTMGTPEYMAPEQILTSGKPGSQADLYSLGMMLYECLAGAPAFTATTTAAILRGHISDPVVPPSQRRGEQLPAVLENVILKCLEKDPANRFQTAEEICAALGGWRAVEVVSVSRAPTPLPQRAANKPASRALQMLPAFVMAGAALVLHMLPRVVEKPAVAAPPPAPIVTAAPKTAAVESPAASPAKIDVTLLSKPAGADMYLGDEPLGQSPVTASIEVSSTPIALVARFSDGIEVTQTIVPDRPLPTITFDKPTAGTPVSRPRPKLPAAASPPKHTGPVNREGTIDPFK